MSRSIDLADRIELALSAGVIDYYSVGRNTVPLIDEMADEGTLALALAEMRRRLALLGGAYPFVVEQSGVRLSDSERALRSYYVPMLVLAEDQAPFRRQRDWITPAVLFEDIVVRGLKELMGVRTRSLRFGTPYVQGRPDDFGEATRWLAGHLRLPVGTGRKPVRRNDGGVDVVVWRPWPDEDPGFPVVLVQCTLERDPRRKIDDINVRLWSDWISFGADPMPALAVPACLSGELLSGLRYGAQLILERLRLAGLLTGQDATPDIQTWVADQLRQILDENE